MEFESYQKERDDLIRKINRAQSTVELKQILVQLANKAYERDICLEKADQAHDEAMASMSWEDFKND